MNDLVKSRFAVMDNAFQGRLVKFGMTTDANLKNWHRFNFENFTNELIKPTLEDVTSWASDVPVKIFPWKGYERKESYGVATPYATGGAGLNYVSEQQTSSPSVSVDYRREYEYITTHGFDIVVLDEQLRRAKDEVSFDLTGELKRIANESYKLSTKRYMYNGDPSRGFYGLFNNPNVPSQSATHTDWANVATTTLEQIRTSINDAIESAYQLTKYTVAPVRLLLPQKVSTRFSEEYGLNKTQSFKSFITTGSHLGTIASQNLQIEFRPELNTAGVGGTGRAVLYTADAKYLRAGMSNIAPREIGPLIEATSITNQFYYDMMPVHHVFIENTNYIDGI